MGRGGGIPSRVQGRPFMVGEHTRAVLADLGYDDEKIDTLLAEGVVGDESLNPSLAPGGQAAPASPWAPDS